MRNIYTHYDKALYHLTTYERFFALPSAQGKAYSGRVKMRDLEKRTGVHRETIRVYFRHGLLPEPERPAPNVADYGETHVQAVLAVRKLQRSEEHTSELQSLMRISYAVFCLTKKKKNTQNK